MAKGASVNVGHVTTSWHVGTHADAPLHVIANGAPSETMPLDAFWGPATVIDARDASVGPVLTIEWLSMALDGRPIPPRLLIRTGQSTGSGVFPAGWPSLTPDAAAWLTKAGLRLFGVDAPSVDPKTATDLLVHHALFAGGAWFLENLSLGEVPDGDYHLSAYPVLVVGADAAPVRAVLESRDR
jgi:arylformamidase